MSSGKYTPNIGDIIWITFSGTLGHEQSGRRPAIVISPYLYNKKTGLCIVCPITKKAKGYPFEVSISNKVKGVILVDQVKNICWQERDAQFIEECPQKNMERISFLLKQILPVE